MAIIKDEVDRVLDELGRVVRGGDGELVPAGAGNPGRIDGQLDNQPLVNEPLQMSGTPSGGSSVSYGANAPAKFRQISQRIRTLARRHDIEIPRGPGRPATQQAMRDYIDFVIENGETAIGAYKPTGGGDLEALWTIYGNTIVIRRSDGEFLTILDATAGGQALNSPF